MATQAPGVYNQETNRGALDDEVPTRALQELYLPPFKAAVTQAHVATLMCAYPRLDGTFQWRTRARPHAGAVGLRRFRTLRPRGRPRRAGCPVLRVELLKPGDKDVLGWTRRQRLSVAPSTTTSIGPDGDVRLRRDRSAGHGDTRDAGGPARHAQFALTTAEQSRYCSRTRPASCPVVRHVGSVAVIGPMPRPTR